MRAKSAAVMPAEPEPNCDAMRLNEPLAATAAAGTWAARAPPSPAAAAAVSSAASSCWKFEVPLMSGAPSPGRAFSCACSGICRFSF